MDMNELLFEIFITCLSLIAAALLIIGLIMFFGGIYCQIQGGCDSENMSCFCQGLCSSNDKSDTCKCDECNCNCDTCDTHIEEYNEYKYDAKNNCMCSDTDGWDDV